MKLALCVLVMTMPVLATADGFEAAARVGPTRMTQSYECDGADWDGHGLGVAIDAEAGWRIGRHASVAGFAGYSMIGYDGSCYDMGTRAWNYREHSLAAGARVQVTARGMFVGFGVGVDKTLETGQSTWTPGPSTMAFPPTRDDVHRWVDAQRLIEGHFGYTFPKFDACDGCALQLFGMLTSTADTTTMRLAFGVQF